MICSEKLLWPIGQNILIPKMQWRELDFARPDTALYQRSLRAEHNQNKGPQSLSPASPEQMK